MKRQRQRVTEKDSVERANESEKVGAGRRRGALLELHACLSRAVTWVKCPEDVGTRAQPERWHQVQSISWVEECRWSKVTRGAVLNGRKCIHLHNLLIVELIYSWNMLKIQQDYSFPNVGICYLIFFSSSIFHHSCSMALLMPCGWWAGSSATLILTKIFKQALDGLSILDRHSWCPRVIPWHCLWHHCEVEFWGLEWNVSKCFGCTAILAQTFIFGT